MVRSVASRDADAALVERMSAGLIHRGPDDDGIFHDGPCAMAARRLSIIDVEHGHQPMTSADGRYALVFNGEIYNAAQLRVELGQRGRQCTTHCDTEVLLHACLEWGDAAVDRLNGMYAFAFYDAQTHRLLLARDRLGIKPLFVCECDGDLYFASELDALLRSGKISGTLNASALDAYFTYLYIPAPETIFRGVTQLRPAETVVWQDGRVVRNEYWRPIYCADSSWTLDSAAVRYHELLNAAVEMQRVSDVPLGAFLSGGIDSASVVAALAEHSPNPVDTFTIGFDDPAADERRYAKAVADRFGTRHTSEVMRPDLAALLPELTTHFGQPFADSSAVPTYLVSRLARNSVTVALSGDGGDELFAGYTWLHMSRRVQEYRAVPEPLRRAAAVLLSIANVSPSVERMYQFNRDSLQSSRETFRRRQSCFYPSERAALYGSALVHQLRGDTEDHFQSHWDAEATLSDDDRMLRQDLRMYLPDDVLTKVDRMSMAASLEVRVPILDHRIVEFAGTLPFHLKYARGESKLVPKHAFRADLPELVLQQRKRGFSIPVDRWFRGELAPFFRETVLAGDARVSSWLNPAEILRIWEVHQSGGRNLGHRLWCLLAFELWLRYVAQYVELGVE